jgi:hypothetical protein
MINTNDDRYEIYAPLEYIPSEGDTMKDEEGDWYFEDGEWWSE